MRRILNMTLPALLWLGVASAGVVSAAHNATSRPMPPLWSSNGLFGQWTPADEIVSLRTENSKTFDNHNGTYSKIISSVLHRRNAEGGWSDLPESEILARKPGIVPADTRGSGPGNASIDGQSTIYAGWLSYPLMWITTYGYYRAQAIYFASELNFSDYIIDIAFYTDNYAPVVAELSDHWLNDVDYASFPSGNEWEDPGTSVWGTATLSLPKKLGWSALPLTTPLSHDMSRNLLVSFQTLDNSQYDGAWVSVNDYGPEKYGYSSTVNPPPMILSSYRADIQITYGLASNPVPTTTGISPDRKTVGDPEFMIAVEGTNFVTSSKVRFDGSDRATTYVSATRLTATILASDLTSAGEFPITVFNPAPGGGTSNPQVLTVSAATGWIQQEPLPRGGKHKSVKDGGALTCAPGPAEVGDRIYAFKGNNRYEFYRYNTTVNTWATMDSIPAYNLDGKKKTVKKGSVLVTGNDGKVYASKGNNTVYFWQYDPATGVWTALVPTVPSATPRTRGLKEGTSAVAVGDYLYLLKGSGTTEFYRYNTVVPGWETMAPAPLGPSNKPFKNGSRLAYDGANIIYAVKGSCNTLYAYDVANMVWTVCDSVPKVGTSGKKKKVKDGSGMAYADGMLYVLKGGNTNEFFAYDVATGTWSTLADMPVISTPPKRVKGGGALAYAGNVHSLYAFRGNNTLQFWSYRLGTTYGLPLTANPNITSESGIVNLKSSIEIAPNPFADVATLTYSLPRAGDISLKLYDASGTLVRILAAGFTAAGSHSVRISGLENGASHLGQGVYLLRLETENLTATRKLILE